MARTVWRVVFLAVACVACGDKSSQEDGGGSSEEGGSTTAATTTTGVDGTGSTGPMEWPENDTAALGEPCAWHEDCASLYCVIFTDAPLDPDAHCEEPAGPWGTMRVTGTAFDLRTRMPVAGVNLKVASALGAAASPADTQSLAMATSDANGRCDVTSSLVNGNSLGLVAVMTGDGYYLSVTGLAGPIEDTTDYLPGNGIHEWWLVTTADLDAWSTALMGDAEVADFLPLTEMGGVVGFVRDAATGMPIAGATVMSTDGGTQSVVRYLAADGMTFTADATSELGIFLIVNPALPEDFVAMVDGAEHGSGTAGAAPGAIFVLVME
jgi:hypothetical protein